jgi:hypothetical protein
MALAAFALAIVTGCSANAHREARSNASKPAGRAAAASRRVKVATTTSTTLPEWSFDGEVPAPALLQVGSDYPAIAISLQRYTAWLEAHSVNVSLVGRVAAPGSKFERALRHDVSDLRRFDRRLFEVETAPPEAELIDAHTADAVTLRFRQHLDRQVIVDESGRPVSERLLTRPTTDYFILLTRTASSPWRLADVEEQT